METYKEPLTGEIILGLVAMSLAVVVIANDFTAFSVALPAIEAEFATDITTVQWIINGYTLVFGVLIVTGGRLADMFGRQLIFFVGSAIFAGFSLLGGLATDMWMLLLARGLMGIGGALMWPAVLGMTYALLPGSRAALAGALIIGAAGFGNCIGPTLGGALTDLASWRWIFLMNLPISALAVLVTWRVVGRDRPDAARTRIDYAGIVTLSISLFALLLSLDLGVDLGWSNPKILALFVLFAAGLAAFAVIERRTGGNALIPDDITGNRVFVAACLATLLMSAIFFAALLYLPQFMIKQLGYSAIRSGTGLLPVMGTFALTSFLSGPLYERLGAKTVVSAGAACLAAGITLLSRIDATTAYTQLVPGMVVLGIGIGLFYSSITTAAITAVDPSRASLAGAIVYMFQVAGGSVGLGFNTALVATATSLTAGIQRAFLVDAGLALCGLVVSALYVGGRIRRGQWHSLVHRHRAHG
jgi:EmrB/QacA subfamily drug resistance transporter